MSHFCGRTRREFLWDVGAGFGSVALTGLFAADGFIPKAAAADKFVNPFAAKPPMFPAKAKSVIFIFCYGGPSQVDTFDYKPKMYPLDGKTIKIKTVGGQNRTKSEGRIIGPQWKFQQYGQCGKYVSDLFPHLGTCVDDIAFIHSMYSETPIHGSAMLLMNSGRTLSGHPALGAWVNYGLGSVNENFPGFVVMLDKTGGPISGAKNWSSGYMPAAYQGSVIRADDNPIHNLANPPGVTRESQRFLLDRLREKNLAHLSAGREHNSELTARIASYELAFNMQQYAPETVDFSRETRETKTLYGIGETQTDDFGRKCLLARRLVERGVRFIQIYSGGAHGTTSNWDAHSELVANHTRHAGQTDKPITGLLKDLKRRGLLDSTLIVWGGEFGRQPVYEGRPGPVGRDHSSLGFTMWLAGGGIKGGISVGETDEIGSTAVTDRTPVRNLHATILNQLGLDPNKLSYYFGGLDQKLVGVEGAEPIREIIA